MRLWIVVLVVLLGGCPKHKSKHANEAERRAAEEERKLAEADRKALEQRGNTSNRGGVKIIELREGTGAQAVAGKVCVMHYTGRLIDGTVFDTSKKPGRRPFDFVLGGGRVIPGWNRGIPGMRVGGKRRLTIPPDLAYGAQGRPGIPPNSTLIFEVELLAVRDAPR